MKARRRRAVLAALTICAAVVIGLGMTSPASGEPARETAKLGDYFSAADIARSGRYWRVAYPLIFASMAAGVVALAVLGLGPVTRRLGGWVQQITGGRWPLEVLLLAVVVTLAGAVASLGPGMALNLYHERAWNLSTQTLAGYLADAGKGTGITLVLTAAVSLGFYGLIRLLPRAWPAVAAGAAVGLTFVLVLLAPVVYEPLFNRFSPVDPSVRTRVVGLAERAGVKVNDVLVADASRRTTKENAYVSGLGASKRVVLYDTLLARSSPNEVDLVVAHEFGHVVHHDVRNGALLGAAGSVALVALVWGLLSLQGVRRWLGVESAADPRSLPFLVLVVTLATILTLPLVNGISRRVEARADRFALELTGDPATAVSVEVRLARNNIADLRPGGFVRWALFGHPPALERIQMAVDYRRSAGRAP